jgi:putative transposase
MRSSDKAANGPTQYQVFRFALDPNNKQRGRLASHAGAARYAYNLGLQWLMESLERRKVGSAESTPNASEMHRRWNRWKRIPQNGAMWWSTNSKCVYQEAFHDLEQAFNSFVASRRGKRRGRRLGFPRFKSKGRSADRFRLTGYFAVDSRSVQLPKLGHIRIHEDASTFALGITSSRIRITSATVARVADRWYVNFRVVRSTRPSRNPEASVVGVDLGINALATMSTGRVVLGPKALRSNLRKLRRLSRSHGRKHLKSKNRKRSAQQLARCHARIASIRHDHLHKLTSYLAKRHGRIVIEDLSIPAMMSNRRLARSIADSGWGELAAMLEYKCRWYGSKLIRASRSFPSSRMCSRCGCVKGALPLSVRQFSCDFCGLNIDRDLNAARNLVHLGEVADSAPETQNACGGDIRPGNRQAGPGEAGTEQPIVASGSEPNARALAFNTASLGPK